MNITHKETFLMLWEEYFDNAELPIIFYYTDGDGGAQWAEKPKEWDKLIETEQPDVVIFFAKPDVLSGFYTLANFDQYDRNGTIAPFGSGCGSIIYYPCLESKSKRQRAIIGMFDPSARPCVPENVLTFAVPMRKFQKMIGYMEESFLITSSWKTVKKRIVKI